MKDHHKHQSQHEVHILALRWHCIGPSCYYFPTGGVILTKTGAVAACAAHGMHIWAPNSQQETADVRSFITLHPGEK